MAIYAIGDVHGQFSALQALLSRMGHDFQRDRLFFVGDLVNRGPDSLAVLRWAYRHRDSLVAVLGNHDLHLIARHAGLRPPKPRDTLDEVLSAPDAEELIDWLRRRPVLHEESRFRMVHAGVRPQWTAEEVQRRARRVEARLGGDEWRELLRRFYRGELRPGGDSAEEDLRVFTVIRTCRADGELCSGFTGRPEEAPPGCRPWFEWDRALTDKTIVFGHWAALGLRQGEQMIALDTGAAWGRMLTGVRLEDGELFQEGC